MANVRNYLLNPSVFSPEIGAVLTVIPEDEAELVALLHDLSLPSLLAQLLVVGKGLRSRSVQSVAKRLKIRVPAWCHEHLARKLERENGLMTTIIDLLHDLYSTKVLDVVPATSLLYAPEVRQFDHEHPNYLTDELKDHDQFWDNITREDWIPKIIEVWTSNNTFPSDVPAIARNNAAVLHEWLAQRPLYDLKTMMCTLRTTHEWPSKTAVLKAIEKQKRQFPDAVPLLEKSLHQVWGEPSQRDLNSLAALRHSEVRVGELPKSPSVADPRTYYVGDTKVEHDDYFQNAPDWPTIVREVSQNRANLVIEGKNGVLEFGERPENKREDWAKEQFNLLMALFLLDVVQVKWRDFEGVVHHDSPSNLLHLLKPSRTVDLATLHLTNKASAKQIDKAYKLLKDFYNPSHFGKAPTPAGWPSVDTAEASRAIWRSLRSTYKRLIGFET